MSETWNVLVVIFCIAGFVPYAWSIIWPPPPPKKSVEPSKATWLIWAVLDAIALAGMAAKGSLNGQIIASTIGASMTALLALKYGVAGWTLIDKICLAGAMLSIILWIYFGDSNAGIITSLVAILIGAWPTFESAWKNPENENKWAWLMFFLACVFAVIAIPAFTIQDAAQPICFILIESTMMYLVWIRKVPPRHVE